jgi:hypothetical protein
LYKLSIWSSLHVGRRKERHGMGAVTPKWKSEAILGSRSWSTYDGCYRKATPASGLNPATGMFAAWRGKLVEISRRDGKVARGVDEDITAA